MKEDTPDRLISDMGTHQIVLTVPGIDKNIVKLEKFEHSIKDDTVVIQSIEPEKDLALLSELIRAKSYSITEIDIRRSSLEDIFLDLTKGNANG